MVSFWQEKCAVRTGNRLIREIEWRGSLSASVPSRAALPRFFLAAVFCGWASSWSGGFENEDATDVQMDFLGLAMTEFGRSLRMGI